MQMKNNKVAKPDGLPAEILKAFNLVVTPQLKSLFDVIWEKGDVPQDFRDAVIVNI